MYRYIALVWNAADPNASETAGELRIKVAARACDWSKAYDEPGAFVVHQGFRSGAGAARAYTLFGDGGVLFGTLFRRSEGHEHQGHDFRLSTSNIHFDDRESGAIVQSGGKHLVDNYWGAYFACIRNRPLHTSYVLRDPTGNMPCYRTALGRVQIFFQDIEDCVGLLGLAFSVNREYLIRWLICSGLPSRDTGLENVEDVVPGESLEFSPDGLTRKVIWNPVEIAGRPKFEEPEQAANELRSVVQYTVSSWATCYERIAHKLSGGLDSSIVAACLAQAPSRPQTTCFNLSLDIGFDEEPLYLPGTDATTADKVRALVGTGDERYFARLVSSRWNLPLIEAHRNVSATLSGLWDAPLKVKPVLYFGGMETDRIEADTAKRCAAQAFFTGEAGDSVFLMAFDPFSAIDYAYIHPLGPDFLRHVVAACNLTREPIWTVLRQAFWYGTLRAPKALRTAFLDEPTLVCDELVGGITLADFLDPLTDLCASSRLPPGKRNHVRGLAAQSYYESVFHSGKHVDYINPLNAQPIWELALQIPTYTLLDGGTSRGLARRAFAELLPKEIRLRQVKGSGSPFLQQQIRRNLGFVRERLEDGLLVREGYLSRSKLAKCFEAEEPFLVVDSYYLASYLTAEIWLQQWRGTEQATIRSGATKPSIQMATAMM
jgi:asparagine synthase (glutamine-hydrolysing)